ncbi:MAG TPA: cell division protein ZipA C-terminal FtsZ-binding domain-containing protein [Steroidobacteraceae bacterium]|nr:cell division protein ZipA C-terminal FtsZ-binding domain-containing protein [Steroidobacteraceae bacterium]
MSELRWILLVVGVVFLIGLTAWESHRSRLARAAARERARALAETIPFGQPLAPGAGSPQDAAAASAIPAWLERPVKDAGPALGELPAATVCDFPLDASEPEEQAIRAERRGAISAGELPSVPLSARHAAVPAAHLELHDLVEPDASAQSDTSAQSDAAAQSDISAVADAEAHAHAHAHVEADLQAAEPAVMDASGAAAQLPQAGEEAVSVEWPPEEQRRIVSVRIVANNEQRLSGRATRQALAACGFVHGRYRIFHQPDAQGHALVSCASLNKPGMFDPTSMDYQRYSGLSLFTVLPGPLSPPEAVDRLLLTALDLSERLRARLQDDAGVALDDARIAELRTRYRELDAMAGPPA